MNIHENRSSEKQQLRLNASFLRAYLTHLTIHLLEHFLYRYSAARISYLNQKPTNLSLR